MFINNRLRMYIIYKITNLVNNKCYIGMTSEGIEFRFKRHCKNAEKRVNHTSVLYKAIRKHGVKNFKIEEITQVFGTDEAMELEKFYIVQLKTKAPKGYNLTDGGEGAFGIKRTKKEVDFISKRMSKKVVREDGTVYLSARIAAKANNCSSRNISSCIVGKRASAGGYRWSLFENDPKERREKNREKAEINKINNQYPRRSIICINTGKFYASITEAAKEIGCKASSISRVCTGKRKFYKGLYFKYSTDEGKNEEFSNKTS